METYRINPQSSDLSADVAVLEEPRGLVVRILTDITARNAAEIRNAALSAWQDKPKPQRLILDLAGVNHHIDSAGVGTLMDLAQKANIAGIPFILCTKQIGGAARTRRDKSIANLRVAMATMKGKCSPKARRLLNIVDNWAFGEATDADCLGAIERLLRE